MTIVSTTAICLLAVFAFLFGRSAVISNGRLNRYNKVKEIIADKKNRHIVPDYALSTEVSNAVSKALAQLVADGSLVLRDASVNHIPPYEIPETPSQPAL